MTRALLLVLLLGGCSNSAWRLSAGTPPPVDSTVRIHTGSGLAAALGLAIFATGAYELARSGAFLEPAASRTPEMAPDRKISEQDCSKPIDITAGNLRCK